MSCIFFMERRVRRASGNVAARVITDAHRAVLWVLPLLYALWTAFHPAEFATKVSLTAPLTERCRQPVLKALEDAKLAAGQIDEVLLVGGSTRMPRVVASLTAPRLAMNASLAVSLPVSPGNSNFSFRSLTC